MSKFLKDLNVGDKITIATFNMESVSSIMGNEYVVSEIEKDTVNLKNEKNDSEKLTLRSQCDNNSESYDCLLNKWHYSGKPQGQYIGIFDNKETLLNEYANVVKSNLDAKSKQK